MDNGIVQVTDDNIDDILDSTYEILLIFCEKVDRVASSIHAQNHPKCEGYRPHAIRAAKLLANLEKPLYFGEVDIAKNRELKERYNATEYPQFIHVYSFGREPEKLKITQNEM